MGKALVILIHGLGGSKKTWAKLEPKLVADPGICAAFDVVTFTYPSMRLRLPFQNRSLRIQDLANSLRTEIETLHSGYSEIILVCHSLGGVIARRYLVEEIRRGRPLKIKGVVFYGVPTTGAELARTASFFSWRHFHVDQLARGSDFMNALCEDWELFKLSEALRATYIYGGQDRIVDWHQNRHVVPDSIQLLSDRDHNSLVKPETSSQLPFLVLKQFLLANPSLNQVTSNTSNQQEREAPLLSEPEKASNNRKKPLVLFDIYRPEVEAFYIQRREDRILLSYITMKNIWLCGPSGCGKTSSALRALTLNGSKYAFVPLGHHLEAAPIELFRAIYDAIAAELELPNSLSENSTWPELMRALASALHKLSIVGHSWVVVEEIPLTQKADFADFLFRVQEVLTYFANAYPDIIMSFLFASINDPTAAVTTAIPRIRELVKILPLGKWHPSHIESLIELIQAELCVRLSTSQTQRVLDSANGSPRFVKMFFLNYLNLGASSDQDLAQVFDAALADTRSEMGE